MSNKSIAKCKQCYGDYCYECSINKDWQNFCSEECEKKYLEENFIKYKEVK